jgi:Alpha/beta-hydrolase family
VEERAELAVADLERAGGFDRAYLLVATTTGSGWLDPGAVDSFEYRAPHLRPDRRQGRAAPRPRHGVCMSS